jgi:hypothetical protein
MIRLEGVETYCRKKTKGCSKTMTERVILVFLKCLCSVRVGIGAGSSRVGHTFSRILQVVYSSSGSTCSDCMWRFNSCRFK